MAEKNWLPVPRMPVQVEQALAEFHEVLRPILYQRGYASAEQARKYLDAHSPAGTQPESMLGVAAAVDRIVYALKHDQAIIVYGDYDVDGVTATALLTLALKALGARVRPYIPNRFEEGYGLNVEALSTLRAEGVDLVITVDCGMRSLQEAAHARQVGLDMIISDHHHPGDELPQALAVINPKQAADTYPEKDLAGVGLAYKLACALVHRLQPRDLDVESFLDLVSLGTIVDLAPLVGENRAMVRAGLKWLRHAERLGLRSLIGVARLKPMLLTSENISFGLGPRLNAAGRLESAQAALDLLMTDDFQVAGLLAQKLESQNRERQRITREIQAHAEQIALANDPDGMLLFASHPDFNPGVVGLAASKLTDSYYRPAIVAHQDVETTRGSCRSIAEFHITEALDECADILVRYGGHKAAAGFTVRNEHLAELVERLKAIAARELGGKDLRPVLRIDAEVSLSQLNADTYQALGSLEPTGYGNPAPVFLARNVRLRSSKTVGAENDHLKMIIDDGWVTYDAIAFRFGHLYGALPERLDLAFAFEKNEFNGRESFQLRVIDLRPASG